MRSEEAFPRTWNLESDLASSRSRSKRKPSKTSGLASVECLNTLWCVSTPMSAPTGRCVPSAMLNADVTLRIVPTLVVGVSRSCLERGRYGSTSFPYEIHIPSMKRANLWHSRMNESILRSLATFCLFIGTFPRAMTSSPSGLMYSDLEARSYIR